jgi:hypothetical protein
MHCQNPKGCHRRRGARPGGGAAALRRWLYAPPDRPLGSCTAGTLKGATDAAAPAQAEALRCWRALAAHGLPVARLDDLFAPLSPLLGPPDWAPLLAGGGGGGGGGGAQQAAAAQARLAAVAEAHLLAAALITQARRAPGAPTAAARPVSWASAWRACPHQLTRDAGSCRLWPHRTCPSGIQDAWMRRAMTGRRAQGAPERGDALARLRGRPGRVHAGLAAAVLPAATRVAPGGRARRRRGCRRRGRGRGRARAGYRGCSRRGVRGSTAAAGGRRRAPRRGARRAPLLLRPRCRHARPARREARGRRTRQAWWAQGCTCSRCHAQLQWQRALRA